jgi:HEPN domain-containing protein
MLLKKCIEKTPGFAELADECDLLATFYVETRYPVHWPATFAEGDAEQAYRAADRIRSVIRREMNLG